MLPVGGVVGVRHREFGLRVSERSTYGATATFREDVSGDTRTRCVTGVSAIEALRELVAMVDLWPGSWRLVAISTPNTIFTDLQGKRYAVRDGGEGVRWSVEPYQAERLYLQRVGRMDLLPMVSGVPMMEVGTR